MRKERKRIRTKSAKAQIPKVEKQKKDKTDRVKNFICVILVIAIIVMLIWNAFYERAKKPDANNNGIEKIDDNSFYLADSGVQVNFSEVLLNEHKEERKIIVSEQKATVSIELEDNLINKLDIGLLKKTQEVTYTAEGYFVVDLDNLSSNDIIQDEKGKTVTIRIDHTRLEAIEINPDMIMIGEEEKGLLALGKIKLTYDDYNNIEKDLRNRLKEELETEENLKKADEIALEKVLEIYEPIVKAIDAEYTVIVEFATAKQ